MRRIIKIGEDGAVNLEVFSSFLDITKVSYYSIEPISSDLIHVTFYDENQEMMKLIMAAGGLSV